MDIGVMCMVEIEVKCPRCSKKAKLVYDEKRPHILSKVKGANWRPLLQLIGHNEWDDDWRKGIAVLCKCKKPYYVHNQNEVHADLMENFSVPLFCQDCGSSFISTNFECPNCQKRIT